MTTRVNFSPINYAIVKKSLKCTCEPYDDVKTYKGWKSEGHQVKKGAKGIHLMTFLEIEEKDKQGRETGESYTRPWHSYVFCKHQLAS